MKHCPEFSQALWCNNSLETLSLVNCNLQDNGCLYLMDGLERNRSLQYVNLSQNNLRVSSAKRIAEVLATEDFKLKTLILSQNYLGDQGGHLIGKAL
jgi:Ran GTPase-activating protein (RanGAP) involved in mRNA processing and transport